MVEPKKVFYTVTHNNISYPLECWEGTTLGQAWNSIKSYYLAGAVVTIQDDHGHSKHFTKGLF